MPDNMTMEMRDRLLVNLVRSCTELTDEDIRILLEVSHSLPFISELERGDIYINVLTKDRKSVVVAQYRHPNCDLYRRNIIGDFEERADEPAVYRALEYGLSGRGLIGVIDAERIMVRHTVSPIRNQAGQVIGALTYEYPNDSAVADTDKVRIRNVREKDELIGRGASYIQDAFLIFDADSICTFANQEAEKLYRKMGYTQSVIGLTYEDLRLIERTVSDIIMERNVLKGEIHIGEYIYEERVSAMWEDGVYEGFAVVLQDKTKVRRMEEEIAYQTASINEVHHRVKNNLQTIISLIGLEAAQSKSEEVKAISKVIISRVCSISITHDLLAHTDKSSVNLKDMLNRVVEGSLESGNARQCRIQTNVVGDNMEIPANMAATIALVVNELILNSLKYAFGDAGEGSIYLTVGCGQEYSWITVRDNGCGYDRTKTPTGSGGLGLKLVDRLVKSSLRGEVTITTGPDGTATRFSFRNTGKK